MVDVGVADNHGSEIRWIQQQLESGQGPGACIQPEVINLVGNEETGCRPPGRGISAVGAENPELLPPSLPSADMELLLSHDPFDNAKRSHARRPNHWAHHHPHPFRLGGSGNIGR